MGKTSLRATNRKILPLIFWWNRISYAPNIAVQDWRPVIVARLAIIITAVRWPTRILDRIEKRKQTLLESFCGVEYTESENIDIEWRALHINERYINEVKNMTVISHS